MDKLEQIRSILEAELGDSRLNGVSADQPLLRSGLINSLEIVGVTVALEAGLGIKIPAASANPENFADLNSIVRLTDNLAAGTPQTAPIGLGRHPLVFSLLTALSRPVVLFASFLFFAFSIDLGLRILVAGPLAADYQNFYEHGHRLYPVAGNHTQDDFEFAVSQHRILNRPADEKAIRIAVFGDSGTFGSWMPWSEAMAEQTASVLRRINPSVEVFNLSYFIRSLPKDLMILGSMLKKTNGELPFDAVVLTLSDEYFSRLHFKHSARSYPHLSINAGHLIQLKPLLGPQYSPLLEKMESDYKHARQTNPIIATLQKHSALFHYSAYLRELLNRIIYAPLGKPKFSWKTEFARGNTPMFAQVPLRPTQGHFPEFNGIAPDDLDSDVVALLQALIEGFHQNGIHVTIYLEPIAPNEWKPYLESPKGSVTTNQLLEKICNAPGCIVADARWFLSGTQFTDSLAHYTKSGNTQIGTLIADSLKNTRLFKE